MQTYQAVPDGSEIFEPNSGITINLAASPRVSRERDKKGSSGDAQQAKK